jgi:hypothetical protein
VTPIRFLALLLFLAGPALSFAGGFTPALDTLGESPRHTLSATAVREALALTTAADRPFRYAAAVSAGLGLERGRWQTLPDGTLSWRLRLHSAGAKSLSLHFAPFVLPPAASVQIYDPAGHLLHGPYTAAQATLQGLWTSIIPGEELVIEARLPAADASALRLGIASVYHGYRDWKETGATPKSGSCNIDVACPQGDAWRDEIRSAARITVNGQFLCSGQLVNNVRQDLRPYFLTANHCGIGDQPGDAGPASSVVFYWNYQTSSCGGTPDGSLSQTQSGSQFVADDVTSDFTLLQLAAAPRAEFNTYFAGWNVTRQTPQSGAGIHHPSGDEKRISLYDTPAQAVQGQFPGSGAAIEGWQVRWAQGVTEGGSSGSGLWDQNRHVVGVLSYGDASCDNQNGTDIYGRLDAAWTASPQPAGQLKAHLDPDNTGATILDGRDATGSGSAGASYNLGGALPAALLFMLLAGASLRRLAPDHE